MKKKKIWFFIPVISAALGLCYVISFVTLALGHNAAFYIELAFSFLITAYVIYRYKTIQSDINSIIRRSMKKLGVTSKESMASLPVPLAVIRTKGEILWYNECFKRIVLSGKDSFGLSFEKVFPQVNLDGVCSEKGVNVSYGDYCYTVYGMTIDDKNGEIMVLQWVENTELKELAQEYYESRQSVMLISIDNYEEITQNAKESEKAQLTGEIDNIIENMIGETTGVSIRRNRDNFTIVLEERYLREIIENKFNILDKVRSLTIGGRLTPTLSIGVGRGYSTLHESEQMAKQALDMALGRGGDQASVKTLNGYEFFGGVSKGIEKRTKVKTRIMAAAITELIETSDNCIIMGHRFADLDCFGAAVGLVKAIRLMGKPAVVAIDRNRNLVGNLIERLEKSGYENSFVNPSDLLPLITKRTLLIIVDTHVSNMLESADIYKACKTVAVIDHHRKMVGHIDDAVIFYHEPYASSASEMVSELIQYFDTNGTISSCEAEALLAGIMLDTKNFVLKTGVRTFEAAAYLRKMGADTVEVKKLFANDMDSYLCKTEIVASAKIYKNCAIAAYEGARGDLRLVAPQAADELLSIGGVDASFVMYKTATNVTVSARSLGAVNVQIIMERMGGGGHLTMAGTYIEGETIEHMQELLKENIDKYYEDARTEG